MALDNGAELIRDLMATLHEGRRAIGEHHAPDDCYATGPLIGNHFRDLIECPACSFIAMYDEVKARAKAMAAMAACVESECPSRGKRRSHGCGCHREAVAALPAYPSFFAAFREVTP